MSKKIPVAILAATGSVGQRFVSLLANHPWFEIVELTASDRSIGKTYAEACHWLLPEPMPEFVKSMTVLPTSDAPLQKARIAFSALPGDIAKQTEQQLAEKGIYVCSNASAWRNDQHVPILVPEVNPDHIHLIDTQKSVYGWEGGIITNPNCTTVGFVVPLSIIDRAYSVEKAIVFSMQAISGAGYPGVPAMDILGNVIPFIGGEEEKLEFEPAKIMGKRTADGTIEQHPILISAHTNRVPVVDAHTICLSFATKKKTTVDEIQRTLYEWEFPKMSQGLPSIPEKGIIVHTTQNRPQPRWDRGLYHGMATSVGRIRPDAILDFRMVTVSHNTVRGAAGGSIVNAELLARCYLENDLPKEKIK